MRSIIIRRCDFTRIKIYGPITVALIMCIPGRWGHGGQSDGCTSRAPDSTWRLTWRKKLQIDLTPRAQVQLLYTVKRANLTRLPIWRSSRSESRQIDRTDTSRSDWRSRSTRFWSLRTQSGAASERSLSQSSDLLPVINFQPFSLLPDH